MNADFTLVPSARAVSTAHRFVVVWVVVWLALGAFTGLQLWRLDRLGRSISDSGQGLTDAGRALAEFQRVPVVGQGARELGDRLVQNGTNIAKSGRSSVRNVHVLAVLLGLTVTAVPLSPVLAVYLPLRRARVRRLAQLRRRLGAGDPTLPEYLAHLAVSHLTYEQARAITPTPYADLRDGRYDRLAAAELRRLRLPLPPSARASGEQQ